MLRMLRSERGMSQSELAAQVGVSNTYISALESKKKAAPPRVLVEALSLALGAPFDSLWKAARDERESRLRQRINGSPTSQRTMRVPSQDMNAGASSLLAGDETRLGTLAAQIESILKTDDDRQRAINILESLLDALKASEVD